MFENICFKIPRIKKKKKLALAGFLTNIRIVSTTTNNCLIFCKYTYLFVYAMFHSY